MDMCWNGQGTSVSTKFWSCSGYEEMWNNNYSLWLFYWEILEGTEAVRVNKWTTKGFSKLGYTRHILVPIEIKKEVEVVEATFGIKQEVKEVEIWVVE